jgi:acyl carrier protein
MGLDTVEIVLAVEEAFGLEISDATASQIFTVGELHAFLVAELTRLGRPGIDPANVYEELRDIICRQLGVEPAAVLPDARFVKDLGAR